MRKAVMRRAGLPWAGIGCLLCMLAVVVAVPSSATAADLKSLVGDYESARSKVKGPTKGRLDTARKEVYPVLKKIARLDSDTAVKWLQQEMLKSGKRQPEVSAQCARALAYSGKENGIRAVLGAFPSQPPVVRTEILTGLSESGAKLAEFEKEILRVAKIVRTAAVKKSLPKVLEKVDSVAGAEQMMALVKAPSKGRDAADESAYRSAVRASLRVTKNDDVKSWLSDDAFGGRGNAGKLEVLALLAGDLKLEDARAQLEKLVENPSSDVAAAALESLTKIGVGDSAARIATALNKRRGSKDPTFLMYAMDALGSSDSEEAYEILSRFATGKDPTLRSIAMGSLGRMPGPRATVTLIQALQDRDSSVRSNALRALTARKSKAVVGVLVSFLETEEEQRLKVDALKLLVNLTQQNFGLVSADWQKWWKFAEATFEFPKGSGKDGGTSVKTYDLEYFGIEVSSNRLGFVVDISSSMTQSVPVKKLTAAERKAQEKKEPKGRTVSRGGDRRGGDDGKDQPKVKDGKARKIDILKAELARVIKMLPPTTQINILTFDANFKAWQKQLQPLAGSGRARAVGYVRSINTGSGTNVYDSLEHALKDKRVDTIYLLTDGQPTRGKITDAPTILKEIAKQNRVRGATIHCIAFGEESDLLKKLAAQNGGQYRFVDSY